MFIKLLYYIKSLLISKPSIMLVFILLLCCLFAKIIHNFHIFSKKRALSKRQLTKKMLNFLYISHIKFELLDLCLLIFSTLGFITLLRYLNFGKTIDIWLIEKGSLTIINLFILITIFLSISLYMKFLKKSLKHKVFRIYLYLLQFDRVYNIIEQFQQYTMHLDNAWIFHRIKIILHFILLPKKDKLYFINDNLDTKLALYLRKQIQKNNRLRFMLETLQQKYIPILVIIEEILSIYFAQIIIFIAILYDLKNSEIKYIYYMICVYSLILLYKTIKETIRYFDLYAIDKILMSYFYKERTHEKVLKAPTALDRAMILSKSNYGLDIYNEDKENIRKYIERDYIIDYVDINYKKSYEPYNVRLLFCAILISYNMFCYHLSIINSLIISIPLILGIIIYELCYKYNKNIKYINLLQIIYTLLIILSIIIVIWLYLTRHTFLFIREDVWSFGYTITQEFSPKDKIDFMLKYISHIIQTTNSNYIFHVDAWTLKIPFDFYIPRNISLTPFLEIINNNREFFENLVISADINKIKNLVDNLPPIIKTVDSASLYAANMKVWYELMLDVNESVDWMVQQSAINRFLNSDFIAFIKRNCYDFLVETSPIIIAALYEKYKRETSKTEPQMKIEDVHKTIFEIIKEIIKFISKFF